jgi:endonuclease YncB( thermonuclease family)
VLIPAAEYGQFERQLPALENSAKQAKIGIWK